MGRRANGSAQELAVSATMMWRRWNNGKPVTVARVREALAKLAATVMRQNGVPAAARARERVFGACWRTWRSLKSRQPRDNDGRDAASTSRGECGEPRASCATSCIDSVVQVLVE